MFSADETTLRVLWKESSGGPPAGVRTGACGAQEKAGESGPVFRLRKETEVRS